MSESESSWTPMAEGHFSGEAVAIVEDARGDGEPESQLQIVVNQRRNRRKRAAEQA